MRYNETGDENMSVKHLNNESFDEAINEKGKSVLVDFWAEWCTPCKMFSPIVEKAAENCGNSVSICKLNIDENTETALKYNVMSIPTVILFKDGKETARRVGALSPAELTEMLEG